MGTDRPTGASGVDDEALLRPAKLALAVIMVATFASTLDSTMVNVALPSIRADLRPGGNVTWVVTAYFLGAVSSLPATGWMSDRFGHRRPFLCALAGFGMMAALSGLAWSLPVLVATRFLQGLTAGPLIPLGMAIIMHAFPASRRGWAVSRWGVAGISGPAIGPTIGGQIADRVSWHWLFALDVPIVLLALVFAIRYLPDSGRGRPQSLDAAGLVLGPLGLAGLLLSLSQGSRWGWGSSSTLGLFTAGALLVAVFCWHELRAQHPVLQLRVLRTPFFVRGSMLVALSQVTLVSRMTFVPLQLDDVRGYSATRIGLLLAPTALAVSAAVLYGGLASDRIGPRRPILAGTIFILLGSAWMMQWRPGTSQAVLLAAMSVQSVGNGLLMGTCTVVAMSQLRQQHLSQGSTVRQIFHQLGATTASAGLSSLLIVRLQGAEGPEAIQSAYNSLYLVMVVVAVVGLLGALPIPRGVLHRTSSPAPTPAPADAVA